MAEPNLEHERNMLDFWRFTARIKLDPWKRGAVARAIRATRARIAVLRALEKKHTGG